MELKWETSFEEALNRLTSLVELIRSGSLSVNGQQVTADTPATLTMEIEASAEGLELEFEIKSGSRAGGEQSVEGSASEGWPAQQSQPAADPGAGESTFPEGEAPSQNWSA